MKITLHKNDDGTVTGFSLVLTGDETYEWAERVGSRWPCSTLSGERLFVEVDDNGLCDLAVNGQGPDVNHVYNEVDGHELDAIVADHTPAAARHLWPLWQI